MPKWTSKIRARDHIRERRKAMGLKAGMRIYKLRQISRNDLTEMIGFICDAEDGQRRLHGRVLPRINVAEALILWASSLRKRAQDLKILAGLFRNSATIQTWLDEDIRFSHDDQALRKAMKQGLVNCVKEP